ncbi:MULTISPECIES: zinc-binding dehydrogenase [unclassified Bosea (in: a-proteobacteria)]|uniref:quinone oxidoreductase family protein n=1 Tax=unclassified Bosea (in: a-proteobacteria) TaxID=2653178 RepID=UPI000F74E3F2|nr:MULTISPECIES: zinc-binding dehydrogenase [unclassified Bosea (in: a-proteobacteria)]AZO79219.1 NADPH:quinone oxidoreductase [Bosea sp. Tri-49]RXT27380.1 NADPH:quinone oxidoreductase [Bosea sp. Tri-39]RXT35915.1 NADPH:quinone oxidoreductase [Bosea sp. Tri-54]
MKAIQYSRFGGPDVLETVEIDQPSPGPGEVLIAVGAVGVNFFEVLMRQDRYVVTPPLPFNPGVEIAGTIAALGEGVTTFSVGERVAAALYLADRQSGGYADYVAVSADVLVHLPETLPFAAATALQVQGLTALHLQRSNPAAGRNVLISAAAGGVGSLLVQLAKRAGAKRVIAMASSNEKLALAQDIGADAGVDYTRPDWPEQVRALTDGAGPDLIFDASGGDIPAQCLALLAPFGRLVLYGPLSIADFRPDAEALNALIFGNRAIAGFSLLQHLAPERLAQDLGELFALASAGELKLLPGGTFPLAQASAAHAALESRQTAGKLVLVP